MTSSNIIQIIFFFQTVCNGDVHSLIIPETFGEDSGTFMVKAVNPAGEAKCYGKLLVKSEKQPGMEQLTMVRRTVEKATTVTRTEEIKQSPPEFTKLFQDVSVKQGEPVMLECIITGTPKPKVIITHFSSKLKIILDFKPQKFINLHCYCSCCIS